MADELTLAPVVEFLALLTAAEIRNSQDPAGFTPPGVLVKLQSFDRHVLGDAMVPTVRVFCVVPAGGGHASAAAELVTLANKVLELVDPDGPLEATSVALPSTPTASLPALAFPLHLY